MSEDYRVIGPEPSLDEWLDTIPIQERVAYEHGFENGQQDGFSQAADKFRLTAKGAQFLSGCVHCSADVMIVDDGLSTTVCSNCGCIWQIRRVLIFQGIGCNNDEKVYDDENAGPSDEELNDLR